MHWILIASSDLSAVAYDERTTTLYIRFHNGDTYAYFGVSKATYDGLLLARSKGRYFHANIRKWFPSRRA